MLNYIKIWFCIDSNSGVLRGKGTLSGGGQEGPILTKMAKMCVHPLCAMCQGIEVAPLWTAGWWVTSAAVKKSSLVLHLICGVTAFFPCCIEGWVISSYVHGLLYSPGNTLCLPVHLSKHSESTYCPVVWLC